MLWRNGWDLPKAKDLGQGGSKRSAASVLAPADRRRRNREAVRRWRARERTQQAASWCDYDDRVLDMLIRRKYLSENESGDKFQGPPRLDLVPGRHR